MPYCMEKGLPGPLSGSDLLLILPNQGFFLDLNTVYMVKQSIMKFTKKILAYKEMVLFSNEELWVGLLR